MHIFTMLIPREEEYIYNQQIKVSEYAQNYDDILDVEM